MKLKPKDFPLGTPVRYRPGRGTYGFEHLTESDGRIPCVVVGHTATRVVLEFQRPVGVRQRSKLSRAFPDSLTMANLEDSGER